MLIDLLFVHVEVLLSGLSSLICMLIDLWFVKEVLIVSVNLYVDRSVVC